MASYRRRGDRWYVEVRRRGQYRSATFRTKTTARMWADEVEADIDAGSPGAQTLLAAFRRYADEISAKKKGARWERIRLRHFERTMPFVGHSIADITPDQITQWVDMRLTEVSPGSVRRELVLLGGVFETARRVWRWIRVNPVRDVPKPTMPQSRDRLITDAEADEIMAAAGYWRGMDIRTQQQLTAAAFDLALETAMRAGEILGLRRPDVDLQARVATLQETKNGYRRQVPLSLGAVEILQSLDSERPFPISSASLSATFRKIRNNAGLHGFTYHDSRATAITRLAKKLDIYELSRLTGHRDLRQLAAYYRATAADIARRLD